VRRGDDVVEDLPLIFKIFVCLFVLGPMVLMVVGGFVVIIVFAVLVGLEPLRGEVSDYWFFLTIPAWVGIWWLTFWVWATTWGPWQR
jgi:hypothetical protein